MVAGLLLLIVLANLTYKRMPGVSVAAFYALLFATLALLYFLPVRLLFFESAVTRAIAATLALCLPVFFASLIFIQSFSLANFQGRALGSNLFGALVGGLLESLSLWFGLRSLTIIAALLYAGSLLGVFSRHALTASPDGVEGTAAADASRGELLT